MRAADSGPVAQKARPAVFRRRVSRPVFSESRDEVAPADGLARARLRLMILMRYFEFVKSGRPAVSADVARALTRPRLGARQFARHVYTYGSIAICLRAVDGAHCARDDVLIGSWEIWCVDVLGKLV